MNEISYSIYFYIHIIIVILGLTLPIFLPKRYIKYMLLFLALIIIHWYILNGECVFSYLDRNSNNIKKTDLESAFFYRLFYKYFDVKITLNHTIIITLLLMIYQFAVYFYRLYKE